MKTNDRAATPQAGRQQRLHVQPLDNETVLVLSTYGSLWLEHAPFGTVPPSRQLVTTDVRDFLALAVPDWVWVLDNEANLWLCSSPFGGDPQQVDRNVLAFQPAFQPLDIDHVVALDTDGKLWLERAPFGQVPPSRRYRPSASSSTTPSPERKSTCHPP